MSQSYIHEQRYAPDQSLMFSFHQVTFDGSRDSFQSNHSTHPSNSFPYYASGPDSGSTSELGSIRAASFVTPSTPTGSNNGELAVFFGDPSPCDHQSPNDHGRTLQGISASNFDAGFYNGDETSELNPYFDGNVFSFPEARTEFTQTISAQIPAQKSLQQKPWSQQNRVYHGRSYPADMVEESEELQQFSGPNLYSSQGIQGTWQHHAEREGIRNKGFQGYESTQHYSRAPPVVHGYPSRENELLGTDSPHSNSPANAGSPADARTVPPRKTGGRTGPLSGSTKENARLMRDKRCCYRCFIMKEQCVLDMSVNGDQVCRRCQKTMLNPRSWELRCTRIGLDERAKYVVPGFLRDQLEPRKVREFLNNHVVSDVPTSSIVLHLTMGFGKRLRLDDTVEVVLRSPEAVRMRGVSPPDRGSVTVVQLNSPPLLPRLGDPKAIRKDFDRWLNSAIWERNSPFPEHCFPEDHEHWQREILTIILRYFQGITPEDSVPYQTLRRALKLVVFNYMMCHPWVVPAEETKELYHQLQGRYTFDEDEWVCPRIANKIIKTWLLPMLNELACTVLTDLNKMLRTTGHKEDLWDPLFCTIFLCLIVVGKFQVSILERVNIGRANNDFSFLENEARFGIAEMEAELSQHLIGQFHAYFGTTRKGNGNGKMFNPLTGGRAPPFSQLAQAVSVATQRYGSHIFDHKDIRQDDLSAMKVYNVTRLLASFMEAFN